MIFTISALKLLGILSNQRKPNYNPFTILSNQEKCRFFFFFLKALGDGMGKKPGDNSNKIILYPGCGYLCRHCNYVTFFSYA